MLNKDTLLSGIISGFLFPAFGFGLVYAISYFGKGTHLNLGGSTFQFAGFDNASILLFALCFNLIPFQIFRSRRFDDAMRGVVFPTFIGMIAWLFVSGWFSKLF